jgi:hypothetical protein
MTRIVIAVVVLAFSGVAHAQSTGYPACDKYFSMVTACMKTKMPPEERVVQQKQLEALRLILKSPFGETAAGRCEENIRIEVQRDRYGCYGAEAAAAGLRTACTLVTPDELGAILGTAFAPGRPGNNACEYDAPRAASRGVRLEVAWRNGRDEMQAWREGVALARAGVAKSTGQTAPIDSATLATVGDDGFYVVAGFTQMMAARKGDVAVSVRAQGASQAQLAAVLRKALERVQ